jgi:gluconate 5-dehydrogenase
MKNLFDLTGKVALVTGASSGLGVKYTKALANQGADIAITARRVDKLEKTKKEIENIGVKCFMVPCDVSKTDENVSMVNKVKEYYGKIDILINNAGVGKSSLRIFRLMKNGFQ